MNFSAQSGTEHAKLWHSVDLNERFDLLHATYITHTFTRHTHEGFAIAMIEEGSEGFSYRHDYHVAPHGTVAVINPGEVHTGEAVTPNGWSYRVFYPNASLLARVATEISGRPQGIPFFSKTLIEDHEVWQRLRQAHISIEQSPSALERESLLLGALASLISRHADYCPPVILPTEAHIAVVQARDYLHAHFSEDISLERLANVAHLSPFHFSTVFRTEFGLPPHLYLTQLRVYRARDLLRIGLPIADAALRTGFVDQSHLNRHFKRILGVTPGQYRKNVQDQPARLG